MMRRNVAFLEFPLSGKKAHAMRGALTCPENR